MADTIPLTVSEAAPAEVVVKNTRKSHKKKLDKKEKTPFLVQHARKNRGVVYINHLPHGFYEQQLDAFMTQFGTVTNIRVGRSSKTGKFKGYAFVEFLYPEIAEIVASTMNNYLMFKKILKCTVVPRKRISKKIFKGKVKADNPPGIKLRAKRKRALNKVDVSEETIIKRKAKQFSKLLKLQKKLEDAGIQSSISIPKTNFQLKSDVSKEKTKEEKPPVHKATPRPLMSQVIEERNKSLKRKRLNDATIPGLDTPPAKAIAVKKSPGTPKDRKITASQETTTPKNLKRPAPITPESLGKTTKKARKEVKTPETKNKSIHSPGTSKETQNSSKKSPMVVSGITTPSSSKKAKKAKTPNLNSPAVVHTPKPTTPITSKKVKTPKTDSPLVIDAPMVNVTPSSSKKAKKAKTPKLDSPAVVHTPKTTTPVISKKVKTPKTDSPLVIDAPMVNVTPSSSKKAKKAKTPKLDSPAVVHTPKPTTPVISKKVKTPKTDSPLVIDAPMVNVTPSSSKKAKKVKTPKLDSPAVVHTPKANTPGKKAKTPKSVRLNSSVMSETAHNASSPSLSKKSKTPARESGNKTPKVESVSTPVSSKKNFKLQSTPGSSQRTPISAKKAKSPKVSGTPASLKKMKMVTPQQTPSASPGLKKGTPGSAKKKVKSPKVKVSN